MTLTAWLRVLFLTLAGAAFLVAGLLADSLKFDAPSLAVVAFMFWCIGAIFGLELSGEIDKESERARRREDDE